MNYIESQWTKKNIIDVNLKHNANIQSMNIKRSQNKMTKLDISTHFMSQQYHSNFHPRRTTSYRPYLLFYLCILTFIFQQYVILSLQVESIFDITFLSRLQQAMICSSVTETIWETKIDIPEVNSITLHYVFEQMVCNINNN